MKKLETLEMMPTRIRIASILRKAILSGEFQEGEELSLTAIANNLGVSRTPVREAFQTLASENLLQLRMNKGAIVKGITVKTIQEHFKMRILLEGEAAARAAMRGFDATHLLEQHRRMLELDGNFSTEQYQSYNQELHTSLWKAADNSKMYSILSSLWNGSSFGKTVKAKDHQLISLEEHGRILEYIQTHNPYLVRKEMEHHIERSMNNIIESFRAREEGLKGQEEGSHPESSIRPEKRA